MAESTHEIDVRGAFCPIPLLRLRKEIGNVELNGLVRILATDHAAEADIAAYCDLTGQRFVSCEKTDEVFALIVQRLK